MPLIFNQIEDLRLRMADSEQKLAESEEERRKLERTCNILMRTLREEEKMHYIALKNRYEKFLEDCTARKRRNDIILRSLSTVEDRAKALFARTQRLKLLKECCAFYLKPIEFKKDEEPSTNWKVTTLFKSTKKAESPDKETDGSTYTSTTEDMGDDKSRIRSDTELIQLLRNEKLKTKSSDNCTPVFSRCDKQDQVIHKTFSDKHCQDSVIGSLKPTLRVSFSEKKEEIPMESILNRISTRKELSAVGSESKCSSDDTSLLSVPSSKHILTNSLPKQIIDSENNFKKNNLHINTVVKINENAENFNQQEKLKNLESSDDDADLNLEAEFRNLRNVRVLREKGVETHQKSIEKLKTALFIEENSECDKKDEIKVKAFQEKRIDYTDRRANQGIIEKEEIEINEKNLKNMNENPEVKTIKDLSNERKIFVSNSLHTFISDKKNLKEEDNESKHKLEENNDSPINNHTLPQGLDGVDYENETYPESYYEQPIHNYSYTNIASNVILEEDENEQETDQSEASSETSKNVIFNHKKENSATTFIQNHMFDRSENNSPDQSSCKSEITSERGTDQQDKESLENERLHKNIAVNESSEKNSDSDVEQSQECDQQFNEIETEVFSVESKNENPVKNQSNLINLLESDSESFKIEHADLVSGNEDSDFDFSLHQN